MDLSNLIGVWSTAQDTARQLQIAQAQRQLAYAQMLNSMRDQQIQQATNLYKAGMPGSAVERTFPMTGIQGLPEEDPELAINRGKAMGPLLGQLLRSGNFGQGATLADVLAPIAPNLGLSDQDLMNARNVPLQSAQVAAAGVRGQTAENVAGINAGSRKDVANINAQSRQNVAGANNQVRLGLGVLNAANGAGESAGSYVPNALGVLGQYAGGLMQQNGITPPNPNQQIVPQPNVKTATQAATAAGNNATALQIALDRSRTAEDLHNTLSADKKATLAQQQAQFTQMMRLKWADLSAQDQHNAAAIAKDYYGIDSATFRRQMSGQGTKLSPYYQQQIAIGKQELNALLQQQNNPMIMADPAKLAALQAQIAQKKGEILGYANSANQDFQQNGSGALDPRDYAGTPQGQLTPAPGTLPPPAMGQQFMQPGNIWQRSGMTPTPTPYQNGGGGNLVPFGPHRVSARLGAVLGSLPGNVQQIIQQNESQGQGNAPDSKGTHLSGDAIDISTRHLSPAQIDTILQAAYQSGLRGAYRAPGALSPNSPPHIHLAYNGGTSNFSRLPQQPLLPFHLNPVNTNDLPPGFPTNIPITGGQIRGTVVPQWTPSRYGVNRRR